MKGRRISREAFSFVAIAMIFALVVVIMFGSVFGFKHHFDPYFFEILEINQRDDGVLLLTIQLVDDPSVVIVDLPVMGDAAKDRALRVGWRYHIIYATDTNGNILFTDTIN